LKYQEGSHGRSDKSFIIITENFVLVKFSNKIIRETSMNRSTRDPPIFLLTLTEGRRFPL